MSKRRRHPDKHLEALLRDLEARGWRVESGKKYFKAKCSCPEKHYKTIHITPSNPAYLLNLYGWFSRQTCWEKAT